MDFNVNAGVDAAKKSLMNYAIPMMVGAFIVAIAVGLFKK